MTKLTQFWNSLPDSVKRMVHTFVQAFLAVFLLGIAGVISSPDLKTAGIALVTAAFAAGLSAVKAFIVNQNRG